MIGAATPDRLRHGAYKVVLDSESYRALPQAAAKSKPLVNNARKGAVARPVSNSPPAELAKIAEPITGN